MIEFTEDDRAALREASERVHEAIEPFTRDGVEILNEDLAEDVKRLAWLAGRLAGLAGRPDVE